MKRIRFLGNDSDGISPKRIQVRRACDACRKGKRACRHEIDSTATANQSADTLPVTTTETTGQTLRTDIRSGNDLSPNSTDFLEGTMRCSPQSDSTLTLPFAGPSSAHSLLMSAPELLHIANSPTVNLSSSQLPPPRLLRPSLQDFKADQSERRPGVAPGCLPMVVPAVLPYLEIESLSVLPPPQDLDSLIRIYREEIHPIVPIVNFATRALAESVNRDRPVSITLRQAICLAASKSASAGPHLKLPEGDDGPFSLKPPKEFADRLFGCLKIALDVGLVADRLELVQVLALMTFHSYGLDGDDEVARLCGQAVHYAYSIGLHCPSRSENGVSEVRRAGVMCSLFAIDRTTALVTGRPTTMQSREVCLPTQDDEVWELLPPGLRLLYRLARMLDRILDLYRPRLHPESLGEECIWEESWSDFEELAKDCDVHTMPFAAQACLEVLYHVIGVISYRPAATGSITAEKPTSSILQSAKVRRRYSAQQISFLLSQETSMAPFVPYAASLSLTVALGDMRQTALESTRRRARDAAESSLRNLGQLADRSWHAESVGSIGRQIYESLLN